MKIFHLSDLHIGKQLHFYNMKQDQEFILDQIVDKVIENRPDVIIIAGDVFDKSAPSGEAYDIFDRFLNQLADIKPNIPVLIIAGNHDSPQRLNYASSFLEKHLIYIETMPPMNKDEYMTKLTFEDEFGEIDFYMLPFTKPSFVKELVDKENISYEEAVKTLIERENIDYTKRNVLISHQFYKSGTTMVELCDSEQVSLAVGGLDCIDVSIVKDFDYVALGHIHGAQKVGAEHIRYSGTPLKYSISEEFHKKSISEIILKEKDNVTIDTIRLKPKRDVVTKRGKLEEIVTSETDLENKTDYISVTLTDEIEPFRPKERLEEVYDHILELKIDNKRTRMDMEDMKGEVTVLEPFEAFVEFYKQMQNSEMSDRERDIVKGIIGGIANEID